MAVKKTTAVFPVFTGRNVALTEIAQIKVSRWSPFGKNRVYEMIHTGELRSFFYQGGYIISKDDLIDYLIEHCDDEPPRAFARGDSNE